MATLTSVTPATGPTAGGTNLTIVGSGFTGATGVTVNGVAATNFVLVDDGHITCTTPPLGSTQATPVDVVVKNSAAAGDITAHAFTYTDGVPTSGFFSHMGPFFIGPNAMPQSNLQNLLDDIVLDLGRATAAGKNNGWSLWDDQRDLQNTQAGPQTLVLGYTFLFGASGYGSGGAMFNQNNATVTAYNQSGQFSKYSVAAYQFQISNNDGAAWSSNVASISNDYTLALTSPWPYATANYQCRSQIRILNANGSARYGYIVLKCTSQNGMNPFYVRLMGDAGYGFLRVDAWETWDNVAHSGANPGPQELLRILPGGSTSTTPIAYMSWFLPDTFGLYAGQDPMNGVSGDFVYIANLDPSRGAVTDPSAVVFACTNTSLSNFRPVQGRNNLTGAWPNYAALISRALDGTVWPTLVAVSEYRNYIRLESCGTRDYLTLWDSALSDTDERMELSQVGVYTAPQGTMTFDNVGKRGVARYLRFPVTNPSGKFLKTFACDDGVTYIMIRVEMPYTPVGLSHGTAEWAASSNFYQSSFAQPAVPLGYGTTQGEVVFGSVADTTTWVRRFFLMPVSI